MSAASETVERGSAVKGAKRSRRSWPNEEKRRIVAEAFLPGASVADVARRYGVNANLLFNWCRTARSTSPATDGMANGGMPTAPDTDFLPIGVFGRGPDEGPALIACATPAKPSGHLASARAGVDERPGMIEIELADGTRLRVDALVNERALRRVVAALKATS